MAVFFFRHDGTVRSRVGSEPFGPPSSEECTDAIRTLAGTGRAVPSSAELAHFVRRYQVARERWNRR